MWLRDCAEFAVVVCPQWQAQSLQDLLSHLEVYVAPKVPWTVAGAVLLDEVRVLYRGTSPILKAAVKVLYTCEGVLKLLYVLLRLPHKHSVLMLYGPRTLA